MRNLFRTIALLIFILIGTLGVYADSITVANPVNNSIAVSATRPQASVAMADLMYENGKIYVVVLVLLTIFAGIILFLIFLERKISKLEKRTNQ